MRSSFKAGLFLILGPIVAIVLTSCDMVAPVSYMGALPTPTNTPITGLSPDMIDDMEDGNTQLMTNQGRNGVWFSYNDASVGGVQLANPFAMGAPGVGYGGTGTSLYAVHVSTNGGFSNWGAGFGLNLTNPQANYDASSHTGIQFYAKNTPGALVLKFMIQDNDTINAVPAYSIGGHRLNINVSSSWTLYQTTLANMAAQPNDYGGPTTFDPTRLQQFQWAVPASTTTDVWIDNLAFY